MRPPRPLVLALLAAGALPGCVPGNRTIPFPLEVGFQPLEDATDAPLPDTSSGYPESLGPTIPSGNRDGHFWAHGRGYVLAPLAKVYQALHDPAAAQLDTGGSASLRPGTEPFPISYTWHYSNPILGGLGSVSYDVVYRGGVLEGPANAPTAVGLRYQKTSGIETIAVLTGSTVARAAADPNVTEVEIVAWLNAGKYQTEADDQQTVRDQFDNLVKVVLALPP